MPEDIKALLDRQNQRDKPDADIKD